MHDGPGEKSASGSTRKPSSSGFSQSSTASRQQLTRCPLTSKSKKLHELEAKHQVALYEMGALVRQAIESGTPVPISKTLEAVHILGVKVTRAVAVAA